MEINETIETINETKSWFFEINKIDKTLAGLTKTQNKNKKQQNKKQEQGDSQKLLKSAMKERPLLLTL